MVFVSLTAIFALRHMRCNFADLSAGGSKNRLISIDCYLIRWIGFILNDGKYIKVSVFKSTLQ